MNAYAKYSDKNNKYINVVVNDNKKYSEIRNKIKSLIKKVFNREFLLIQIKNIIRIIILLEECKYAIKYK